MTSSMSSVTRARVSSSRSSTFAGVKWALMRRLYSRWAGGSICSGMAGTEVWPDGTVMPCSELKLSQSWAMASTSS